MELIYVKAFDRVWHIITLINVPVFTNFWIKSQQELYFWAGKTHVINTFDNINIFKLQHKHKTWGKVEHVGGYILEPRKEDFWTRLKGRVPRFWDCRKERGGKRGMPGRTVGTDDEKKNQFVDNKLLKILSRQ